MPIYRVVKNRCLSCCKLYYSHMKGWGAVVKWVLENYNIESLINVHLFYSDSEPQPLPLLAFSTIVQLFSVCAWLIYTVNEDMLICLLYRAWPRKYWCTSRRYIWWKVCILNHKGSNVSCFLLQIYSYYYQYQRGSHVVHNIRLQLFSAKSLDVESN